MSIRSNLKIRSGSVRSILFFSLPFLFFFGLLPDYISHLKGCQEKVIHRAPFAGFFFAVYSRLMISQRRFKKIRRLMLNNARNDYSERLKEILRPKPRWMPKRVWKFLINLLLDLPKQK